MVRRSNAISRETCQVQNVDEQIVRICSEERCSMFQARGACRHHKGNEIAALGRVRLKRLAGVRALVVATKRCSITPWSKGPHRGIQTACGGQEGRCERTNVT